LSGCKGELVSVNLAGLDDTMFSDTLFGHKRGAFTGAEQLRDGLVVKAANGVILLDEIGDLGESSQIRLLRLIQEKEFYPVGSDIPGSVSPDHVRRKVSGCRSLPTCHLRSGRFPSAAAGGNMGAFSDPGRGGILPD
jgi:sigma54-dependent transcription regulator